MKTLVKDLFLDTVPPRLANLILPRLLPGASPFKPAILETGVIFVHVPKAAGSAIKTEIYGQPQFGHRRIAEFDAYDRARTAAFFKFAFVRNPWDRLLSAFTYLRQNSDNSARDRQFARQHLAPHADFAAFVTALQTPSVRRSVMAYDHFRPQSWWICRPGETVHAMDFLGRFEQIETDMAVVRARLNCTQAKQSAALPQVRPSQRPPYRDAYSPRLRDIVAEVYAADIALTGYHF